MNKLMLIATLLEVVSFLNNAIVQTIKLSDVYTYAEEKTKGVKLSAAYSSLSDITDKKLLFYFISEKTQPSFSKYGPFSSVISAKTFRNSAIATNFHLFSSKTKINYLNLIFST